MAIRPDRDSELSSSETWSWTSEMGVLRLEAQRAGATLLLGIYGELDTTTAPHLRTQTDTLLAQASCDDLIISCEGLTFIDSSGLSTFATIRAECRETDIRVHLVDRSEFLDQLLDITGLGSLFG